MKILNLKFKNINSLAGCWEIDFTTTKFTDNGIFAITGKTGAGKSSILNAISLALYGKTPRVEITGQSNDVMTRGTSDCYAEIVFQIGGKKWKSAWKQERTRTGNLKSVNRQIADEADKIYADHVRSCDIKIIEILGLTFQQFTKVVMLAQGGFTAFLQADSKDKGELLEQITGTDIYGEISRKVFERNKVEKEKLDKILFEIGAIKILTDEEIEALHKEIADSNTKITQIDSELQLLEAAKRWLVDIEKLSKQIVDTKLKLPDFALKVESSEKELIFKEIALKGAVAEKELIDKLLVKVRELDTQIAEKNKALEIVLPVLTEITNTKNQLSQTKAKLTNNLIEKQGLLQKKQDWATTHLQYESLLGAIAVIENNQTEVNSLLNEFNSQTMALTKANKILKNNTLILKEAQNYFTEKQMALSAKEKDLLTQRENLSTMLAGKELVVYQEEKENIIHFCAQLKNLIDAKKDLIETQQKIDRYQVFINESDRSTIDFSQKISANQSFLTNIQKQIQLLDENIKLTKTIKSLDEHRRMLEDGKPCPLCGSLEHPFALGNEPKSVIKK